MPVSPPGLMLKVIWLTHFILTSWALFGNWLPGVYMYTHMAVLAFGFWAIVANESTDAALMFFVTLLFSILNDILCLALYEPRAYDNYERSNSYSTSQRNEYRFALGMAITNLILKPVTIFLALRIYQSRVQGTEYNPVIPGLDAAVPRFGGAYDNIDSNQHQPGVYGKPSDPPTYQAPGYQEPPPHGHP